MNIDEAIHEMTKRIVSILDGSIHSIWLYGSAAFDDFHLGWSDIDFIALTKGNITETQAQELLYLRQSMSESNPGNLYYRSFEGIVASIHEYRLGNYKRVVYWGTSGQRITDSYQQDAFSKFELSRYGQVLYGNDDRSIFSEPAREELIGAVKNHYESIRKYAKQTNEHLYSCGWLLDIARCIYTLRYNDIIAKTQAGIWALNEHLFDNEAPLQKTIEIRQNPLEYKDKKEIKCWLSKLGPLIQQYANVLENELMLY